MKNECTCTLQTVCISCQKRRERENPKRRDPWDSLAEAITETRDIVIKKQKNQSR